MALIHFRKILSDIDVGPLVNQLSQNSHLWNLDDQWTKNKPQSVLQEVDDIVLRYNKSPDWNKPAFSILAAAQSIIFDLMRAIPGEHLGKVIISRLLPQQCIAPHIDHMPPGVPPYYQRYQIPLSVFPGVRFHCGDEELYMEPGNAFWFDNQIIHSVVNDSSEPRISMLCDIRPFIAYPLASGSP
jgi:hypothetical protein